MPRVSQAHAEVRRTQILRAAARCIAREGLHRTTMQQVCAEARLSPGSVYTWFPSKQAIIKELARRSLDALREALAAGREDPARGLRLYLEHIGEAAADPEVGWMNLHLVAHARRDRGTRELLRSLTREGLAVLKQACRRLPSRSRPEADARARLLQAAALGIVLQSLVDPEGEVASFDVARRVIAGA